jgi:hypothetical protein
VRRHEPAGPRRAAHDPPPREAEALPAEAAVLGLQRSAGNRAVSALLARQPSPAAPEAKKETRAATSTLGLGDEIGVIPLDSANLGRADRDGHVHDLSVMFVNNPAMPKVHEAMLKGKPIPEGFYSSTSMKLSLEDILITSIQMSDDPSEGEQLVSMSLHFTGMRFEPVR